MASVLSGLFKRVSDPDASRDALEDFTTEALAGAIRRDPRPMLFALGRSGAFDPAPVAGTPLTVVTQRTFHPPGDTVKPDLVLTWPAPDPAVEVWIEAKTGSGLSGDDQLVRYLRAQRWRKGIDRITRAPVILLAPSDLRADAHMADVLEIERLPAPGYISWQGILDAVRATDQPDSLWLELAQFLKEKRMTKDIVFPISAREATSLEDAYSLYLKSRALLKQVNTVAKEQFPNVAKGWWNDGNIAEFVRKQFRDHGRFMLGVWGKSKIGLLFGLEADQAGEATFTVWLEADPKYPQIRSSVHARYQAAPSLQAAGWTLRHDGWQMVECRAHTVNYPTIDSAVSWFMDRFGDLERAGLFALQRELMGGDASVSNAESQADDGETDDPSA